MMMEGESFVAAIGKGQYRGESVYTGGPVESWEDFETETRKAYRMGWRAGRDFNQNREDM